MPRKGMGSKLSPQAVPVDDGRREYGDATRDIRAQEAVPMGPPPGEQTPVVPARQPGDAGPLGRVTEQPDVPVTDGIDLGPGRGSEAMRFTNQALAKEQAIQRYRNVAALVERTGDPFLRRLLDRLS